MRNLTKNFRSRAAILIALAYAFCVLAPSGALAAAASPASFRCLDELSAMSAPSQQEGLLHTHADGAVHHHDQSGVPHGHSGTSGNADAGNCCGLFCVFAIAHDPDVMFGPQAPASPALHPVANGLTGCGPSRLHRPPIA